MNSRRPIPGMIISGKRFFHCVQKSLKRLSNVSTRFLPQKDRNFPLFVQLSSFPWQNLQYKYFTVTRKQSFLRFYKRALVEVGRFEFNERPRRPIFPRFSYPVELRVSAQLCFNCTAIINYSPPRRKYSYRCSRVNKGRITLPPRVAPSLMQF